MRPYFKLLLFLISFSISSCTTIITNVSNTSNVNEVEIKKINSYKKGETCALLILSLGPFGNSSVIETAIQANIDKIVFVDTKTINYFVYRKNCLVVYGI